ncbi:7-dehydrocholesterol reductase, partial [Tanacetum coccineum]
KLIAKMNTECVVVQKFMIGGMHFISFASCKDKSRLLRTLKESCIVHNGRRGSKSSIMLTSVWRGLACHFYYVPQILAVFFWTVATLFDNFLQYFYFMFLTILLFDRARRDDDIRRSNYLISLRAEYEKAGLKYIYWRLIEIKMQRHCSGRLKVIVGETSKRNSRSKAQCVRELDSASVGGSDLQPPFSSVGFSEVVEPSVGKVGIASGPSCNYCLLFALVVFRCLFAHVNSHLCVCFAHKCFAAVAIPINNGGVANESFLDGHTLQANVEGGNGSAATSMDEAAAYIALSSDGCIAHIGVSAMGDLSSLFNSLPKQMLSGVEYVSVYEIRHEIVRTLVWQLIMVASMADASFLFDFSAARASMSHLVIGENTRMQPNDQS